MHFLRSGVSEKELGSTRGQRKEKAVLCHRDLERAISSEPANCGPLNHSDSPVLPLSLWPAEFGSPLDLQQPRLEKSKPTMHQCLSADTDCFSPGKHRKMMQTVVETWDVLGQ